MATSIHGKVLPIHPRFEHVIDSFQEVVAERLRVKSDGVRSQQTIQQFALPWTNAENLRIRPRNVPED